jgi:hypothetical protein
MHSRTNHLPHNAKFCGELTRAITPCTRIVSCVENASQREFVNHNKSFSENSLRCVFTRAKKGVKKLLQSCVKLRGNDSARSCV